MSRQYGRVLGVTPENARDGLLQDNHWTRGFGYFPTYALGNLYNAMYVRRMRQDFDLDAAVAAGDFATINRWMAEHVFLHANHLTADEWLRDITGRALTAEDFLSYLETKYRRLYGISDGSSALDSAFRGYARRMRMIRLLSSPQLDGVDTADAFRSMLAGNFRRIGNLAQKNRGVLRDELFPLLHSEKPLEGAVIQRIRSLNEALMDPYAHDNIDLPIMALLSERLLRDARQKGDSDYLVRQLDDVICACVGLVVETRRVVSDPGIVGAIRREGRAALEEMLTFLEEERFEKLSMESRELVMIDARYGDGLFLSQTELTQEERSFRFALLRRALSFEADPFFRRMLPHYDWQYHRYRTLQYLSSFDEFGNAAGFNSEELQAVADYGEELEGMWQADTGHIHAADLYGYIHSHTARNRMHAGRISPREYRETIRSIYEARDPESYSVDAIIENIELPCEYLSTFRGGQMSEQERTFVGRMYDSVLSYLFSIPKMGVFYELMVYFAPLALHFVEVPGGLRFGEFVLKAFAAFHPPTFVHSIMVAKISRCLALHLLRTRPELLAGVCGCKTAETVQANADRIIDFIYAAALSHDFGKLIIIDTVFVYGRNVLDREFEILKQHPALGARMLEGCFSTREYAEVALWHHLWYDGSAGYPLPDADREGRAGPSPAMKPVVDLVACADCMDAATDRIGRSYAAGKTLDQYVEEVRSMAGTRYAPHLAELLGQEEVLKDLRFLLEEGRQETYRDAWRLLKGVQDARFK